MLNYVPGELGSAAVEGLDARAKGGPEPLLVVLRQQVGVPVAATNPASVVLLVLIESAIDLLVRFESRKLAV